MVRVGQLPFSAAENDPFHLKTSPLCNGYMYNRNIKSCLGQQRTTDNGNGKTALYPLLLYCT